MSEDNLSAVLKSAGDLRLENTSVPEIGSNDVLISIHSVGICGSDVHYWTKGAIGNFIVKSPMILGHESSGTVVKIGCDVKNLKIGDKVAIEPGVPCRYCDFCKTGFYNLCADIKFCATPPYDGTLCRYYAHPADFCYKLPDHVSLEEGALLEPLSVAVHACRRAEVKVGNYVLVCGAGPIGLVNIMTARTMGASKICVTDISDDRLKIAKKIGADFAVNVKGKDVGSLTSEVMSVMGRCPDITIECSGAESSAQLAVSATKSGGVVSLVGMGPPSVSVPLVNVTIREINLKGVFRYANCYPLALELVSNGAVNLKSLITHKFKLEETLKAFETSKTGEGGAIKVIINCEKNA